MKRKREERIKSLEILTFAAGGKHREKQGKGMLSHAG